MSSGPPGKYSSRSRIHCGLELQPINCFIRITALTLSIRCHNVRHSYVESIRHPSARYAGTPADPTVMTKTTSTPRTALLAASCSLRGMPGQARSRTSFLTPGGRPQPRHRVESSTSHSSRRESRRTRASHVARSGSHSRSSRGRKSGRETRWARRRWLMEKV
ncbi:hypothetical protein DFJ74DRAFT_685737 [Hyaloraphidium curvatum]|nr:hypothetical protein DFJ74DRAFT_685737 [Hyaloraphidium curvatum]